MQIAQEVGADVGILSDKSESPLAVGDRIKTALGPRGPAVVFDCVGFEATMQVPPYRVKLSRTSRPSASPATAGSPDCLDAHHTSGSAMHLTAAPREVTCTARGL